MQKGNMPVFLICLLLVAFSACGGKDSTTAEMTRASVIPISESGEWAGAGGCYTRERVDGLNKVWMLCTLDDTAYLYMDDAIYRYSDGNLEKIFSLADGRFISGLCVYNGGIRTVEHEFVLDDTTEWVLPRYELVNYSIAGELLSRTPLDGDYYTNCLTISGKYMYLISADGELNVLSLDGEKISRGDIHGEALLDIVPSADGVVAVLNGGAGIECRAFSPETGMGTKSDKLDDNVNIHGGYDDYDYLISDAKGLYGSTKGEQTPLIIWSECGMTFSSISRVCRLTDGSFVILSGTQLYLLRETTPDKISTRTVVTLGSVYSDIVSFSRYIQAFNEQSDKYLVQLVDIAPAAKTLEERITSINTQMATGSVPDVMYFSNWSPENMGAGGFLVDLYGLIDADMDIGRDSFLMLEAMDTNGALYAVSPGFIISTFVAPEELVGQRYGWTFDEFFDIQSTLTGEQSMIAGMTQEGFLNEAALAYIPSVLNTAEGACSFDNDEFTKILTAAGSVTGNEESVFGSSGELLSQGRTILCSAYLDSVNSIINLENESGINLWPIGFPSADGACTSALFGTMGLGICKDAKNADGAWEFIKFVMTDTSITVNVSFPAYVPAFESELDSYLRPYGDIEPEDIIINPNGGFFANGKTYETNYSPEPLITQRQVDMLYGLIDNVEKIRYDDGGNTALNIILSEAQAFFNGDKTAEETAGNIQSRISVFASEQG